MYRKINYWLLIIVSIFSLFFCIVILSVFSCKNENKTVTSVLDSKYPELLIERLPVSPLTAIPEKADLGNINEFDLAKGSVKLLNNSQKLITITEIKTSCGCVVVHLEQNEIKPKHSLIIPYTIDTARKGARFLPVLILNINYKMILKFVTLFSPLQFMY
jgi:hypothetical protein